MEGLCTYICLGDEESSDDPFSVMLSIQYLVICHIGSTHVMLSSPWSILL